MKSRKERMPLSFTFIQDPKDVNTQALIVGYDKGDLAIKVKRDKGQPLSLDIPADKQFN